MKHKSKPKNRVLNWVINIVLVLLLLVGLALVFNDQIKNYFIKSNGEEYAVAKVTRKDIEKNQTKEASFDFDAVEPISSEAVIKAQMNKAELPTIGGIAIPSVAINLPIFKGVDNVQLFYGAGTMSPDQVMGEGNYALASHRALDPGLLFTPLENMHENDPIYLTDLTNVYTYKTTAILKVAPTDVELLDVVPDKKIVTLVTCGDIEAVTRIVVQGELESVTPIDKVSADVLQAFQMQTRTF